MSEHLKKIGWDNVIGQTVFWAIVLVGVLGFLFLWKVDQVGTPEDLGLADRHHILRHLHELRDADPAPCYFIGLEE